MAGRDNLPVVAFDGSKKQSHHPASGFKRLQRNLKMSFKVLPTIKDGLSPERLKPVNILVIGNPRMNYTDAEFATLKTFLNSGGSILMLGSEGSEKESSNINTFLDEYGVQINQDCVVRCTYRTYKHPKECVISNGVLNREINNVAGRQPVRGRAKNTSSICFVYPFGATLNVHKPSVSVLSSSTVAYPTDRPIAGFYQTEAKEDAKVGHMVVLGSVKVLDDEYLDKEDNTLLQEVIFKWLSPNETFQLNVNDAKLSSDQSLDYNYVPDIDALSRRPRGCMQNVDTIPKDFTDLFNQDLFRLNTHLIPESISLYKTLGAKHEPLALIPPQFNAPLPPCQPALFPPMPVELPTPPLEQFDLDNEFADIPTRLAHQTNMCSVQHLDYYVLKCGEILDILSAVKDEDKQNPKKILEHVFRAITNWRRINFAR